VEPPKLLVYLRVGTDEAISRIRKRGREDEVDVEREYWDTLNRFYEENYKKYKGQMLTLQVDKLDYVHREEDRLFVVNQIKAARERIKFSQSV